MLTGRALCRNPNGLLTNNITMNNSIEGWTPFSNPRIFAKYGRQRGWERAASGNELSATGSDFPTGFRELTKEEAQQIEIPF